MRHEEMLVMDCLQYQKMLAYASHFPFRRIACTGEPVSPLLLRPFWQGTTAGATISCYSQAIDSGSAWITLLISAQMLIPLRDACEKAEDRYYAFSAFRDFSADLFSPQNKCITAANFCQQGSREEMRGFGYI